MIKERRNFQQYCADFDDIYVLTYKSHAVGHKAIRICRRRCDIYQIALATRKGSLVFQGWGNQQID